LRPPLSTCCPRSFLFRNVHTIAFDTASLRCLNQHLIATSKALLISRQLHTPLDRRYRDTRPTTDLVRRAGHRAGLCSSRAQASGPARSRAAARRQRGPDHAMGHGARAGGPCSGGSTRNPQAMRQRRETVEHPFGTIKARMGATHFLMNNAAALSPRDAAARACLQSERV